MLFFKYPNKKGFIPGLSLLLPLFLKFVVPALLILGAVWLGIQIYNNNFSPQAEQEQRDRSIGTDHLTTLDPDECGTYGYRDEGVLGYVYTTQVPGTIAIRRCYLPDRGDHLTIREEDSVGCTDLGGNLEEIYYVSSDEGPNTKRLYRCLLSNGDHMLTDRENECSENNGMIEDTYFAFNPNQGGTVPLSRCYLGPGQEEGQEVVGLGCEGRVYSAIKEDPVYGLNRYRVEKTQDNSIILHTNLPEETGDIDAGRIIVGYIKRGNDYYFINKFGRGMQFLVTVVEEHAENENENSCNINADLINLREDIECSLMEGQTTVQGTGLVGTGADMEAICPLGKYMKGLYREDYNKLIEFYSKDYVVLCCSETIEI
ncbi:MAG: hypothetical protein AABY07_02980 [Nanoarchaeota archaeon]